MAFPSLPIINNKLVWVLIEVHVLLSSEPCNSKAIAKITNNSQIYLMGLFPPHHYH
jgi:hypothetical protein